MRGARETRDLRENKKCWLKKIKKNEINRASRWWAEEQNTLGSLFDSAASPPLLTVLTRQRGARCELPHWIIASIKQPVERKWRKKNKYKFHLHPYSQHTAATSLFSAGLPTASSLWGSVLIKRHDQQENRDFHPPSCLRDRSSRAAPPSPKCGIIIERQLLSKIDASPIYDSPRCHWKHQESGKHAFVCLKRS